MGRGEREREGGRRGRNTQTGCTGAWGIRGRAERKKNKMEGHRKQRQKTGLMQSFT